MIAIADFAQKVREKKLLDAFTLAVNETIELKITTWVSTCDLETQAIFAKNKPARESCLYSRINLVKGEINNEIGSEIITNRNYTEIEKLHQEQVIQARTTILKNLASLQKMFAIVGSNSAEIAESSLDNA